MEINSIDKPNTKKTFGDYLKILIYKLGGTMEIAMIIFFWLLIFNNTASFEGFSREEIITYILVGGIIGLFGGYMLSKIIIHGISHESIELLIKDPYQYFLKIFKRSLDKMFIPFVSAVFLQVILLYFLVENIIINLNLFYWVVILIMIFLSLMFYLFRILFITNIESKDIYHIIVRLKNIFAGRYFPLSMLGFVFLNISLSLPFAYSFFVPTQLYLREIDIMVGVGGLFIQLIWIFIFYWAIRFFWQNRNKKEEKKKWQPEFKEFQNN